MALVDFGVLGSFTIPDQHLNRAKLAAAKIIGGDYQQEIWDPAANAGAGGYVPNPETEVQYASRMLKEKMIIEVKNMVANETLDAARATINVSDVDVTVG